MKTILMIAIALIFTTGSYAQKTKKIEKEKEVRALIESQQFRFVARSAHSSGYQSVSLTSEYDLVIDSLQIKAHLPFYGRAYYAEYGSSEGGIKFDSKAEEYSAIFNEKKKSYQITIKVRGKHDIYQLQLDAGLSGYATLSVVSIDKQSISFYGTIEKIEK